MIRLLRLLPLLALLVPASASAGDWDHGYAELDALLRAEVDGAGMVDYAGLKADPAALKAFVGAVGAVSAEEVGGWTRAQQIAFYTNAYNAITLQTIVEKYPLGSIRDIRPDPWEDARWLVAGRKVSLNWIEHSKLRKTLNEPRVHFTLVCAAMGCPKLRNRAYTAAGIEAEMNAAAKGFFTDRSKNRVDTAAKQILLSSILDWYGGDFVGWTGGAELAGLDGLGDKERAGAQALGAYLSDDAKAAIAGGGYTVKYLDYDWALNKQ